MILNKIDAAYNIGPGDHIEEMMEDREWTQQDLADVLGVSLKHVNKLLSNEQAISLEIAKSLADTFGPGPDFWMNVDASYRLYKAKETENDSVSIRSEIYQKMPIGELFRKGWLQKTRDAEKLKKMVCDFWDIDELDFGFMDESILTSEFRKSEAYSMFSSKAVLTWLQMAKNVAGTREVKNYDRNVLTDLADKLSCYTVRKDGINVFLDKLKEAGVIFIVLEHLQKTYLDGAAFMRQGHPVIVYTGRFNRNDHFWFTVAHEIAHVLLHIRSEEKYFIDDAKVNEQKKDKKEEEANAQAALWLRQPQILELFSEKMKYIKQRDIEKCADEWNIHPGIVVGTLAFHGKVSYRHLHKFADKILEKIPPDFKIQLN